MFLRLIAFQLINLSIIEVEVKQWFIGYITILQDKFVAERIWRRPVELYDIVFIYKIFRIFRKSDNCCKSTVSALRHHF